MNGWSFLHYNSELLFLIVLVIAVAVPTSIYIARKTPCTCVEAK